MKNKKGFTLVELIATIAVIGLLLVISTGAIINSIGGAKSNITDAQKELLFSTAELYFDDNVDVSLLESDVYNVCIQKDLVEKGYFEEYKDSDGNDIKGEIELHITGYGETITKVKAKKIHEDRENNCGSVVVSPTPSPDPDSGDETNPDESGGPTLAASGSWYTGNYENQIRIIKFVDSADASITSSNIEYTPCAVDSNNDGINDYDIKCYITTQQGDYVSGAYQTDYVLTIAGNGSGKIFANTYSDNLFSRFRLVKSIQGLSLLDTTNVTNMSRMFFMLDNLTELDVSSFDTRNVTNMSYMFYECELLREINVTNFNTENVTNMSHMFGDLPRLYELNVSSFDTSKVEDMTNFAGFYSSTSILTDTFKTFIFGENFGKGNALEGSHAFLYEQPHVGATLNTTVYGANDIIKSYNWAGDYRNVTFAE